jgi:hypothetical protein
MTIQAIRASKQAVSKDLMANISDSKKAELLLKFDTLLVLENRKNARYIRGVRNVR